MSVFTGEQTKATTDGTVQEPNQDYLESIVKAKGDQWKDPQVLAKGYVSSQQYITELENKNKELESKVGEQDYAKNLLTQLQEQREPSAPVAPQQESNTGQENTTPSFSEDELKSLVEATLNEKSQEEKALANLRLVDSQLDELYGEKAESVVEAKAKELGLDKKRMEQLAAEAPQAFMRLVGKGDNPVQSATPTSTVNTTAESFNRSAKRDWGYYSKLKKEDPKWYRSARIQQQMFEDRVAQGTDFYT